MLYVLLIFVFKIALSLEKSKKLTFSNFRITSRKKLKINTLKNASKLLVSYIFTITLKNPLLSYPELKQAIVLYSAL